MESLQSVTVTSEVHCHIALTKQLVHQASTSILVQLVTVQVAVVVYLN